MVFILLTVLVPPESLTPSLHVCLAHKSFRPNAMPGLSVGLYGIPNSSPHPSMTPSTLPRSLLSNSEAF